jgi:ABC-type glycerol-3-phosphate transport system substrate-binding protein
MKSKITAFSLIAILLFSLFSCQKAPEKSIVETSSSSVQHLVVRYDNTRFGDVWIKKIVSDYESLTPNVKIQLISDNDIDSNMSKAFISGNNIPDVAFMTKTNWQYFVTKGYLSDITDLYNQQITDSTLLKSILPEMQNFGKLSNSYYVVPWTSGVSSFLYNADMFKKNNWEVPATTKDLLDLVTKIKLAHIVPFVWAGKQPDFWAGIVTGWWAQFEGQAGMSDYLSLSSADLYNQPGRLNALSLFEQIIKDKTNSYSGSENSTGDSAVSSFFNGEAAMMPGYSWTEYKYNKFNKNKSPKLNIQMMSLPVIDNAATPISTNMMCGDFICIPSKTKNLVLAKAFVAFTSNQGNLSYFTSETGTPRPFNIVYDNTETNIYANSVLNIWQPSKKIFMFSKNSTYYNKFLDWPYSGDPYMQIYYGDETAKSIVEKNYQYAKTNWNP